MKFSFTSILFFFTISLFAQQSSQHSMYMLNPYSVNHAYAGMENSLIATADIRKQWINLNGSPSTQNLTIHLPVYFLKGGLGFQFENDQLGATRNTSFKGSYNYIHSLSENANISIAASAGIIQQAYDGSVLRSPDGDYEPGAPNHNDPLLSTLSQSSIIPTLAASVMLQISDFNFGLSANDLIENEFTFEFEGQESRFAQKRHYFAFTSYDFEINDFVSLKPVFLLKSDLVETQLDVNLIAELDQKFIVGGGYRGFDKVAGDGVVIIAGIKLNDHFTLAYSYDLGLSSLNNVHNGSHEFLIKYDLNKKIGGGYPPNIKYNPRFL